MNDPRRPRLAASEPEARDSFDGRRIVRGLAPEVQPVARYLLRRVEQDPEIAPPSEPLPRASLDATVAAVRAVREHLFELAERDAPPQRLRVFHGRLDREFAALVRDFVERRRDESRELLRDVSHDLRSPLNSILVLADALAGEHSGSLNEVQQRQVGVLYAATVSLVGLLNDLLDAAHLDRAEEIDVVREAFSVENVLDQVDRLLGPLARNGAVTLAFRLETLGPRTGDRRILTRVLLNLVTNALQASERGGWVEVRAFEERSGWLTVTVSDSGTGGDLERLRARLSRALLPAPGRREEGWTRGLGLGICARLVEATAGEIRVDAVPGSGGCRFTLHLPYPRD